MRKTKMISVRCTEKEYDKLKEKAFKEGLELSKYVLERSLNGRNRMCSTKKDRVRIVSQMQVIIDEATVNAKMGSMTGVETSLMKLQEEMDEVWKQ